MTPENEARPALEGVVEEREPRQIGPGNVPGPLEPTVIPRVEAAHQLKKELRERYPGVDFSVRSDRAYGSYGPIRVDYDGGPPADEVEAVCADYVGYRYESYYPGDGGQYHPLPGRWVGGLFIRYDVSHVYVYRLDEYAAAQAEDFMNTTGGSLVDLYTATAYLRLSNRAILKLIRAGDIVAGRRGKRWDIDIASLRAYKQRHTKEQ